MAFQAIIQCWDCENWCIPVAIPLDWILANLERDREQIKMSLKYLHGEEIIANCKIKDKLIGLTISGRRR